MSHFTHWRAPLITTLLALLIATQVRRREAQDAAKPYLHPLFTDHMVFQRGIKAPVWGWTQPGKKVTVGMDGKTVIHPTQVPIANEAFAPSKEEIAWARKVIEAFSAPDNAGKGVITVGGRMVERLHERQARRILETSETMAAMHAEEWSE